MKSVYSFTWITGS